MRHDAKPSFGLIVAAALVAALNPGARADESIERLGSSRAYADLGKVAVMHEGRVKPLDTVAREEVKQVHGTETVILPDPEQAIARVLDPSAASQSRSTKWTVRQWGPVGTFLGWTIRPEFWDDQPFILVDYFPLRRLILSGTVDSRLQAIAAKETTPADEKERLRTLAADPEISAPKLIALVRGSRLPESDRHLIAELAVKLTQDYKWLSPRELREARIPQTSLDGQRGSVPFLDWAMNASRKKQLFDHNPRSAERPTEVERRSIDVAHRLDTYQGYSGDQFSNSGIILVMPRPSDARYLAFTARAVNDVRNKESMEGVPPMQLDALAALDGYWKLIPRDDHKVPGENADIDAKFSAWLRDSSVWVPLKTFLKAKPDDLVAAGYPESAVKTFLDGYHEVEKSELQSPGNIDAAVASRFLSASRSLGEAVSPRYPSSSLIERETAFNAVNPFFLAPFSYASALLILVLSLTIVHTTAPDSRIRIVGQGAYWLGLGAMAGGISLEVYGFIQRILISGWAPVTNMYETVIWVALVSAVLALIFELAFRQVFVGVAGSFVALLCTLTAASVPLLDPSIRSLQPVLRDNFWLGTHVLAVVSSYAAFGLAWGLGLLATLFYLTATYRRSPRLGELALPLVPWLPVMTVGAAGVAASYGLLGPKWAIGDSLFYVFAFMGLVGGMFSLASLLSIAGELLNRLTFREPRESEEVAGETWASSHDGPAPGSRATFSPEGGGVATLAKPTVAEIRALEATARVKLDARGLAMQRTAAVVKPLASFVYRAMQVGVLLIAAGTILGGVWADYSWGRFWGWDAKEVWALATLVFYLVPLHGRFAGWVNTFWLVFASVFCFNSVVMAWYGVNFVLGVGLHSYGFTEGGSQGAMMVLCAAVLAFPVAAAWRRHLGYRPMFG